MKRARIPLAAFVLAVLASSGAHAQLMGTQPYQPSFRGLPAGTGLNVGMSPAYRQAILNQQLLGRESNPLVRDQNGFLIDIDRRDHGQAFPREQSAPFLVAPASGNAASVSGIGVGYGLGNYSAPSTSYSYAYATFAAESGASLPTWIAMLDESGGRLPWSGVSPMTGSAGPLNTWIGQLESPPT